MDSDLTQTAMYYRWLAWFEVHKKQVAIGATAAILLGIIVYFFIYQHEQKQIAAEEALSKVFVPQVTGGASKAGAGESYLAVARQYPGSPAAERAALLGAGALFGEGKFAEAQKQFELVLREHRGSVVTAEAQLGVAACLDAQGRTNEAITAYQTIVDRRSADNVIKPAKFSLARLHEGSGNAEKAYNLYEDIARTDPYSSVGSEAGMRAEELKQRHPELAKKVEAPAPTAPSMVITNFQQFSPTTQRQSGAVAPAGTNAARK